LARSSAGPAEQLPCDMATLDIGAGLTDAALFACPLAPPTDDRAAQRGIIVVMPGSVRVPRCGQEERGQRRGWSSRTSSRTTRAARRRSARWTTSPYRSAREFVSVVGPSGAGKSTRLHLIGGLHVPTAGKVLLEGQDLGSLSDEDLSALRHTQLRRWPRGRTSPFHGCSTASPLAAARGRRRAARTYRARRACRPSPGRAVRRRDAAGGGRAGPHERSGSRSG
jgi:hypothetical protein